MTDLELQLWLAARLPEQLQVFQTADKSVWWIYPYGTGPVKDTEWEHIVWLIERGMDVRERSIYTDELGGTINQAPFSLIHKSWQQRAQALIATLGEKKGEK